MKKTSAWELEPAWRLFLSHQEARSSCHLHGGAGLVIGAGARIEVIEEQDGLKLHVVRAAVTTEMAALAAMAGLVKAPAHGVARRLQDFDSASC